MQMCAFLCSWNCLLTILLVTIRTVTGIIHSLVYDFAQTESYSISQPLDVKQNVTPEDDVSLYRISGAALCQMIKLRKDTLSEKKGKGKLTSDSMRPNGIGSSSTTKGT